MANNDRDITIGMKAVGAEQTRAAIQRVQEANKGLTDDLNRLDSLRERAELLQENAEAVDELGESSNTASPKLDKIIGIQRAQVAFQIGQSISRMAATVKGLSNDFKETDKELSDTFSATATGLDSLSGALSGAAQGFAVGGPFGAAVGGTIGLLTGPLKEAFTEMTDSIRKAKEAEKEAEESVKRLATARRAFADQVKAENLEGFFNREFQAIDKEVKALESRDKIAKAQRDADAAIQENFKTQAKPDYYGNIKQPSERDVAAQKVVVDLTKQLTDIDAKVSLAASVAAELESKANLAKAGAETAAQSLGEGSDAYKQLESEAAKVVKAAEAKRSEAEEVAALADAEKQKLLAETAGKFQELTAAAGESVTATAAAAIESIKAVEKEQGGQLAADARGAMERLTKLLTDSIPDSQQIEAISQAMMQFRGSQDAVNNSMVQNFDEIIKTNRTTQSFLAAQQQQIKELGDRISQIQR